MCHLRAEVCNILEARLGAREQAVPARSSSDTFPRGTTASVLSLRATGPAAVAVSEATFAHIYWRSWAGLRFSRLTNLIAEDQLRKLRTCLSYRIFQRSLGEALRNRAITFGL